MGRVGMDLDLVAEFVMGRVCQGPSLSLGRVCYGPRCPGIKLSVDPPDSSGFYHLHGTAYITHTNQVYPINHNKDAE